MQTPTPSPGVVSLRQLFPQTLLYGGDVTARGCSSDWRRIRHGDLFVAIVDEDGDGHEQARRAVDRGAVAVIAERPLQLAVPVCIVEDTREALGLVCQTLAGYPAHQQITVAVSGTSGKTVTGELIASVLRAAGHRTASLTSLGWHDGLYLDANGDRVLCPETLAHTLRQSADNECSHAVIEVSSAALAQRATTGVEWDIAVLTNLRSDHLDLHGNLPNYRRAKARLFAQLTPNGCAVLNADDRASRDLLASVDRPALTFGTQSDAQVSAGLIEQLPSEQTFMLTTGNESIPVRTATTGTPYLANCLAAATAGLALGLNLPTIARGLESLTTLPGRLERLECGQDFSVFVDSADTPDQLGGTLRALRSIIPGRLICVYGARSTHSRSSRAALGRVAERFSDLDIITNDNPGNEPHFQMVHDILDGYHRPAKARVMPSRADAITWALQQARSGDCVLVTGKGERRGQYLSDGWHPWDDREYLRTSLYATSTEYQPPTYRRMSFPAPELLN